MARNSTKRMIPKNWLAWTVYYTYDLEAHKNLSHKQFALWFLYYFIDAQKSEVFSS